MKYLLIIFACLFTLSGCFEIISPKDLDYAKDFCESHEGLDYIYGRPLVSNKIKCKDGSEIDEYRLNAYMNKNKEKE